MLASSRARRHIRRMSFKIEQRIGVPRSKEQVWAVLCDLPAWKDWNPMYPEVSGKLLVSAPLHLVEKVGGKKETLDVTVAEWVPNQQVIWVRRTHGGLVRQVRYIEMEALSETGCIFANGTLFEGRFASLLVSKGRRNALKAAYRGLCEAMQARVEAGFGEDTEAWKRV